MELIAKAKVSEERLRTMHWTGEEERIKRVKDCALKDNGEVIRFLFRVK
jgi:hypothetical protein